MMTVPSLQLQSKHPSTRVELFLSARDLKNKDVLSKSDPMCIVLIEDRSKSNVSHLAANGESTANWIELGRTETVKNNLNPQWNKKLEMHYFFETQQKLRFEIYDVDNTSPDLAKQDFLGRCECQLSDIVASPAGGALTMPLKNADELKQKGELIVRAEEVDEGQKEIVQAVITGIDLPTRSCFCFCIPLTAKVFLEIWRVDINQPSSGLMVHRTEVVKSVNNPTWKQFEITVRRLCEGDKEREFLVKCFKYKANGSHKLIGECSATVAVLAAQGGGNYELTKDNATGRGTLQFTSFNVLREYTWLDYIFGGLQLEFAVAVDFTLSNGDIRLPSSLHHLDSNFMNQYELAIHAVLEVIEHYNLSKQFEATGFGAKIPPYNDISHFFPLNQKTKQTWVNGIQGVMEAYKIALQSTQLGGPTNFEPTIRTYLNKCSQLPKDGSRYQILMIITDGIITDLARTIHAIIDASDKPLSIIIIGVGKDDFNSMDILDSDRQPLTIDGRTSKRDIVQFVPFHKFYGAVTGAINKQLTVQMQEEMRARLANAVLEEVPYQVTSWMKSCGIVPRLNATGTQRPSKRGQTQIL